jgi:hypothetical protein
MSYAKPIWNEVENCQYKTSKSYGNKDTGQVTIYVGSSSKNSHELVKHITTRRLLDYYGDGREVWVFRFGVEIDGKRKVLAVKTFKDNKGRAGDLIESLSYL